MYRTVLAALLVAVGALAQDAPAKAPIASRPVVELQGEIASARIARGQGMPFIEVKTREGVTKVRLGSIRYLMEQDFNPRAGQKVSVKGYSLDGEVVAISVKLEGQSKELRLRDADGWPLWSGRCCMRGR